MSDIVKRLRAEIERLRAALREIAPGDVLVFAKGDERQEPSRVSGDDLTEPANDN